MTSGGDAATALVNLAAAEISLGNHAGALKAIQKGRGEIVSEYHHIFNRM